MSEHEDIIAGLSEHEHPLKGQRKHTILLDLDVPAKLVPSTTEGHSHLYIDINELVRVHHEVTLWLASVAGQTALNDAGIVYRVKISTEPERHPEWEACKR